MALFPLYRWENRDPEGLNKPSAVTALGLEPKDLGQQLLSFSESPSLYEGTPQTKSLCEIAEGF